MSQVSLPRRLVRKIRKLLRRPGYWITARRLSRDGFDRIHGTDTNRLLETRSRLGIPVHRYETASASAILAALDSVPLDLTGFTFIDLGCGKGKPLLIAAGYPFRRVIGVDISEPCLTITRQNLAKSGRDHRVELVVADVLEYELPAGPLLIYLFNPFPAPVVEHVVSRLVKRLQESSEQMVIVYMYPKFADVIERTGAFERVAQIPGREAPHERADIFLSQNALASRA